MTPAEIAALSEAKAKTAYPGRYELALASEAGRLTVLCACLFNMLPEDLQAEARDLIDGVFKL